ncbi:oxysterol-binding protein-related protein 10-like [Gadus morhua]|uniref:oxysterol-binding protein-related protein 10-like n=1 Tax=Gadus morhua TaxID=8049 RepID=UPI0011B7778F|nr:oxysterol-binding protein-related protein 10-like [Gadus morhua]
MNRSARHGSSAAGRQQVWTGRTGSPVGDGKAGGPAAGGVQGGLSRGAQDGDAGPGPPQLHQVRSERLLEGVLRKYTNLLQGWQNRYFVLNQERSHLLYFLNESCRSQRPPRGSLPLLGASVVSCEEFPFMFTVFSVNGDVYKLRASDAQEQRLWMTQLQLCSRRISDTNDKVMNQVAGQQKNLVNSIESLPPRGGPLSSLDEDLLLLKATSAATLSCLGDCLSMLQHNVAQALTTQHPSPHHNHNQNHVPIPVLVPVAAPTPTPTGGAAGGAGPGQVVEPEPRSQLQRQPQPQAGPERGRQRSQRALGVGTPVPP